MTEKRFMTVNDVMEYTGVSQSEAYKIMRELNAELKDQGFYVVRGKLDQTYFLKRMCYQA